MARRRPRASRKKIFTATMSASRSPNVSIKVTDDWPENVPISEHELRVVETHMARVLAQLLGPLP